MKRILTFFFFAAMLSESPLASSLQKGTREIQISSPIASKCSHIIPGIQGPPGPPGPGASTASGSFYSQGGVEFYDVGDSFLFRATSFNENIDHPNDTDFIILQTGYYLIFYGAVYPFSNDYNNISIYIDGLEVESSRLDLVPADTLSSISTIVFLQAGQTVTVRNNVTPFNMESSEVQNYINFLRLAP